MSRALKSRPGLALSLLFVLSSLVTAPASRAEEEAASAADPSLAAVETLQEHIAVEVREGRLPETAGQQASEIGFELEADLIRADAEIRVLTLEVQRFTGERQAEALENLIGTVAARERSVFRSLRRLEKLAGGTVALLEAASPEEAAKPAKEKAGKKTKIDFEFKAEDLTKDPEWPL